MMSRNRLNRRKKAQSDPDDYRPRDDKTQNLPVSLYSLILPRRHLDLDRFDLVILAILGLMLLAFLPGHDRSEVRCTLLVLTLLGSIFLLHATGRMLDKRQESYYKAGQSLRLERRIPLEGGRIKHIYEFGDTSVVFITSPDVRFPDEISIENVK